MPEVAQTASAAELVAELLHDEGYRAKVEPGTPFVRSSTGGVKIGLIVDNDAEGLQIRCAFSEVGPDLSLERINEYNARFRYGKMYKDSDDDIVLEQDFLFDPHRPDAADELRKIMSLFEGAIGLMKTFLVHSETREEAEAEAGG